ncbi:MAG: hypothetical protein KBF60_12085 [Ignavibacteriaceae bacterium]|nr:hypothetical protein [Ignavibacteriaceae bacterium]
MFLMTRTTGIILVLLCFSLHLSAQTTKGDINVLMMRGEKFKEGVTTELVCSSTCLKVDKDAGFLSFSLSGKYGERNINVSGETPVLKGTKKIKVDKDGDLGPYQKLTIEVFGANPAVDKDSYEIQEVSDEAIIIISKYDEANGVVEGTFTCKYFDEALGIKMLSATCHFLVSQN